MMKKEEVGSGTIVLASRASIGVIAIALFVLISNSSFAQSCESCFDESCLANCTSPNSIRPTNIFGQIIDEDGTAVHNEIVSARWVDASGRNQSATTKTMTKEEAHDFGNPKLDGFFLFTDGNIRAKTGSFIEIRTQPRYTFILVEPEPGRTKDIGSIKVFGIVPEQAKDIRSVHRELSLAGILGMLLIWFWNHLLYTILILITIISGYISYREHQRRKRIRSVTDLAVYRAIRDFSPTKVEDIMQKNIVAVQENERAKDAMKKILDTHHGSILVMRADAVLGLISEHHLVKVFLSLDEQSSAAQCMEPLRVSTSPTTPLLEALRLMVHHRTRKLPVVKNQHTLGLISMTDIAKAIHAIFSKKVADTRLPHLSAIYKAGIVRIHKDASLQEVITLMTNSLSEYCIVHEFNDLSKKIVGNIGIITAKDILKELYKGADLQKTKAQHIMSSPIISLSPKLDALQAMANLLEKNVRIVPIIESDKIVGVVNEEMVMAALYHYISSTTKKIEEFKKLIT